MSKKTKILIGILILTTIVFAYGSLFYSHGGNVPSGASLEPPSANHFFGTDDLGVDIFAQLSMGYFNSMLIGVCASAISFVLGGVIGIAAGYRQGRTDTILSFVINVFLSVPQLPIMIVIGAFFGQSTMNIIIIVAMFSWARIAKVIRAKTISIKNNDYIKMASSFGGDFWYIFKTHMLRDLMPILCVNSISVMGRAIIQESSLAYLGLSDPTSRSWGLMINKAMSFSGIYYTDYWKWWMVAPICCLVLTILCIRLIVREIETKLVEG